MSFISGVLDYEDGMVITTAEAPVTFNGGTPTNAAGALSVTLEAPVTWNAGVGFDADGRLCVDPASEPAAWIAGFPFTNDGRLCVTGPAETDGYVAGVPLSGGRAMVDAWDINLTGAAIRAAYEDPSAFGTTGSVTGWRLPGLAAARLSADSMTGPRLVRQQDGTYAWAPHNLLLWSDDLANAAWTKTNTTVADANIQHRSRRTWTVQVVTSAFASAGQSSTIAGPDMAARVYLFASTSDKMRIGLFRSANGWVGAVATKISGPGTMFNGTDAPADFEGLSTTVPTVVDLRHAGAAQVATLLMYPGDIRVAGQAAGDSVRVQTDGVNLGPIALPYVPTGATARFAPPVEWDGAAWGVRGEPAATNRALWSRDLSNAAWVKTNATATLTATGILGDANSASVVTATAGNATVLQAITHTSTARTLSMFLRRRTGTGTVETTIDGGTTWVARTLTSSWQRFETQATLANPSAGVRIVTSGDAIDVDFVQPEDGAVATSPTPTFGAAVTRTADNVLVPGLAAMPEGTVVAEYVPQAGLTFAEGVVSLSDGTSNNYIDVRASGEMFVGASGVEQVAFGSAGTPTAGARNRVAAAWGEDNFSVSLNGAATVVDTEGTVPSGTNLRIGTIHQGSNLLNGSIRTLRLIRRRLPNARLQSLTL